MRFTLGKSKLRSMHVVVLAIGLQSVPSWTMAGIEKSIELKSAAEDGFSLSLPRGWREIPKQEIQEMSARLAYVGGSTANPVKYAVQGGNTKSWFVYPYANILVNRSGATPSAAQLNRLVAQMREAHSQAIAAALAKRASGSLVKLSTLGADATFDAKRNVASWSATASVEGIGLVHGYTEVIPTKYGFIELVGYFTAEQRTLEETRNEYRTMFRTIRIDEKAAADPR